MVDYLWETNQARVSINALIGGTNVMRSITLKDTVLVSGFHTNIASLYKFITAGVHWDTKHHRLTYSEDKTFCDTLIHHDRYTIQSQR